uniref:FBA_2 domain-containing protein n=1 Tax=Caenorhabditis tropicalis TaxID=1561998 RepID=A0A1I7U5S1_9PELO
MGVQRITDNMEEKERIKLGMSDIDLRLELVTVHNFELTEELIVYEVVFHADSKSLVQLEIHEHIKSLFRFPSIVVVKGTPKELMNGLIQVEDVIASYLDGEELNVNTLDDFFSFYPNQKSTEIFYSIQGELTPDSKLLQIDNIILRETGTFATSILRNFKGKRFTGFHVICDDSFIIQLMKKWIESEDFWNLEVITFFVSTKSALDPVKISEEFEMKPWDESKRPRGYFLGERIYGLSDETIECGHFMDIERKKTKSWGLFILKEMYLSFLFGIEHFFKSKLSFIELIRVNCVFGTEAIETNF